MQYSQYIALAPGIRFGKPCAIGTRIAIEDVPSLLANGTTVADIAGDLPELHAAHIQAVPAFPADRERAVRVITTDMQPIFGAFEEQREHRTPRTRLRWFD